MAAIPNDQTIPPSGAHDGARWSQRPALSDLDHIEFVTLRQVCGREGVYVEKVGDHYRDDSGPLLPFVEEGVLALLEAGYAKLIAARQDGETQKRLVVTAAGRDRYENLCDQQGVQPYQTGAADAGEANTRLVFDNECG